MLTYPHVYFNLWFGIMNNVIEGNFKKNMKKTESIVCSMCGAEKTDELPFISNSDFSICGNCVSDSYNLLKDYTLNLSTDKKFTKKTPSKIVEFLDQYVIGQNDAKKVLALAIYNHYKRMHNPVYDDVEIQKSNILMIGPSGTGKTLLIQTIARFLDIPFAIADATSLSATGWVGDDVETILQRLIQAADGDVEKARYGIIYIDEFDKIAKKSTGANHTKDPAGEGVQQGLLKIIEGTNSRVPKTGGRKVSDNAMDVIDTTHILFICGGAFVDLDNILNKNNNNNTDVCIGFGANVEKKVITKQKNKPEPKDLFEYGMIPELIGRLPVICTLNELDVDALKVILTEPKNSIVKQMSALVNMDGAKLEFSDESITKIAEISYEMKTGARGLRSIIENTLNTYMFELPDQENVEKIFVDVVDNELTCNFIKKGFE